jgi:hypothetical protein
MAPATAEYERPPVARSADTACPLVWTGGMGDEGRGYDRAGAPRVSVRGRSVREIARTLHISRNTVRKILRSGETEFTYERTVQPQPKSMPVRSSRHSATSCPTGPQGSTTSSAGGCRRATGRSRQRPGDSAGGITD